MPRDVGYIHAGTGSGGFENRRDRVAMQAGSGHVAVTIDSAEYCALGDLGAGELFAECFNRARIFLFAKRNRDLITGLLLIGF